jgi:pyruvate carboxylase subunit B
MRRLKVKVGQRWYTVEVGDLTQSPVQVKVNGELVPVNLELSTIQEPDKASIQASIDNGDLAQMKAPMPGVIVSIDVRVGDRVSAGSEVYVLETMKMEQSILAPRNGVVRTILVQSGQNVTIGEVILELS